MRLRVWKFLVVWSTRECGSFSQHSWLSGALKSSYFSHSYSYYFIYLVVKIKLITYIQCRLIDVILSKSVKVVKWMWICIAHQREPASNALPLPVRRRRSPPPARYQRTLQDHGYGLVHASHGVPVYSPSFRWILTPPNDGGWAQAE